MEETSLFGVWCFGASSAKSLVQRSNHTIEIFLGGPFPLRLEGEVFLTLQSLLLLFVGIISLLAISHRICQCEAA